MGITRSIEQYFVEHDDGEFTLAELTDQLFGSLVNVASQRKSQSILYCTKPKRIEAYLGEAAKSANLAIVGQNGLPDVSAIEPMKSHLEGCSLLFLGDMDPVENATNLSGTDYRRASYSRLRYSLAPTG